MNSRNIGRMLAMRHEDFISSIKNEKVRELVKKNSIISGGVIASLLMGERFHDIDYYFTNRETVLAVAQYYVAQFNEKGQLRSGNVKFVPPVVYEEGDRIRIRIQSAGIIGEDTDTSKYQYFEGRPEEEGDDWVVEAMSQVTTEADKIDAGDMETMDESKERYRPVFLSDNAITLSNGVQLVIRFYGTPDEIHDNFDYVHCTNYWTSKTGKVTLRSSAIESILSRELRYTGSRYPLCSIIRLRKFLRRGWWSNAGQILKMCLQLNELDLKDVNVLQDQLTGVDTAYFFDMIQRLKKAKEEDQEFTPSMPYLVTIIDKLF